MARGPKPKMPMPKGKAPMPMLKNGGKVKNDHDADDRKRGKKKYAAGGRVGGMVLAE